MIFLLIVENYLFEFLSFLIEKGSAQMREKWTTMKIEVALHINHHINVNWFQNRCSILQLIARFHSRCWLYLLKYKSFLHNPEFQIPWGWQYNMVSFPNSILRKKFSHDLDSLFIQFKFKGTQQFGLPFTSLFTSIITFKLYYNFYFVC